MKPGERDKSILAHIREYCSEINATIERFGNSQDLFESDFVYRNATLMCILQIGELVGNLTEIFKNGHPQIPWQQIKAMRNIMAHHYGNVDAETAWEVVQNDIPKLDDFCWQILSDDIHEIKKEQ